MAETLWHLTALLLLYCALLCSTQDNEHLYFSTPGERNRFNDITRPAGLYGGQLSLSSQGTGSDLYYAGYHCTEYGPSASSMKEYDSLDISSLSYDPRTAQVLIEVAGEENRYLTVLKGPLCGGFHECRNNSLKPIFFDVHLSDGKYSAFALYDNNVYYIRTTDKSLDRTMTSRTVELRKLEGCEDELPFDKLQVFEADRCSKLVATIASENYDSTVPIYIPSTLTVAEGAGGLHFFVQLRHVRRDPDTRQIEYYIQLYQATSKGKVTKIHRDDIDIGFLPFSVDFAGSISIRDKKICWSTVNSIYCGTWNGNAVSHKTEVLAKGTANQVCEVTDDDKKLSEVVSGVAIAKVSKNQQSKDVIDIYFGCMGHIASNGGAGLLTYTENGESSIVPVLSNNTGTPLSIFADHLFLSDACKDGHGPEQASNPVYRAVSAACSTVQTTLGLTLLFGTFVWLLVG